jgi:hypothetical protein
MYKTEILIKKNKNWQSKLLLEKKTPIKASLTFLNQKLIMFLRYVMIACFLIIIPQATLKKQDLWYLF